jgi:hypothetical protein
MTKEQMIKEIVELVCEKGKGLSLLDAVDAIYDAFPAFLHTVRLVDGMIVQSKEEGGE